MKIEDFKKGNTVHHKKYGQGIIDDVFLDERDSRNEGVLVTLTSKEGIDLLNKDRTIDKKILISKDILTRVFVTTPSELFLVN